MRFLNIIYIIIFLSAYNITAQNVSFDLNQNIPIDPNVKTGTLSNGLTYYLKHNEKPKNKAELRLVLNVGSILEDNDQQGFAHFVEHMAFNGTKSFHKNDLIDYLQRIGVQFGADLNAHTGFDETVYKLTVPTDIDSIYNTSLHILRDWADGIEFSDQEIDNERGIVAEELRARSGASMRMYYQSIPVLTNNSRYAERIPIGKLDLILNGKHKALKRFYKDWYRPDLMALVIVGDIDLKETETKIKKLFSSIKPLKNPRERIYYSIPDNKEPKATIITDKEASFTTVAVYYKKEKKTETTLQDYRESLLETLYTGMLNQRLSDLKEQANSPFLATGTGIGKFLGNKGAYYLRAALKENQIKNGIEDLLIESERAKKYGFTNSEFNRYKNYLLNRVQTLNKEADKLSSKSYTELLIDNFTDQKPIPGVAFNYKFYKNQLANITLDEVNGIAKKWIGEENITIVINAPEKKEVVLPSEDWILKTLKSTPTKNIETYKDKLADKALMETLPSRGEIIETKYNKEVDITTFKLSNGVTVIAKPTTFQNDIIYLNAFRPGGSSTANDSIYVSTRNAGNIIGSSGINNISDINLKKLLMGKTVSVTPRINYYEELVSGNSNFESLETLFQMVHLYFTAPNKDQNAFNVSKNNMISSIKAYKNSPSAYFNEEVSKIMSNNHLRAVSLTEEQIEKSLNLDQAYNFYKERFSSANEFTFIFVGSFDLEAIKDFSEQYLASLPSDLNTKSTWKDIGLRYNEGSIKQTFYKGIDNKASVDIRFTGKLNFSLKEKQDISLIGKLLKIKLTEELREKMSGVYGVRVSGFASDKPYDWYRLNIQFTCDPANVNKLIKQVNEEINKLKTEGPKEEDVSKIKKAELANAKTYLEYNGYWASKIKTAIEYNLNFNDIPNYKTDIEKLNTTHFKKVANRYFNYNNYAEFILLPEKNEK